MPTKAVYCAALVAATLSVSACATPGTRLADEAAALRAAGTDQQQAAEQARGIVRHRPIAELRTLADDGDRVAAFVLGHYFEAGYGDGVDLEAALKWYSLAATPVRSQQSYYQAPVGGQAYSSMVTIPVSKLVVAAAPGSRDRVATQLGKKRE